MPLNSLAFFRKVLELGLCQGGIKLGRDSAPSIKA